MKTVLIAVGENGNGRLIIEYALKHILKEDDKIILLHVRNPIFQPIGQSEEREARYLELEREAQKKAKELLTKYVEMFDQKYVDLEIPEGEPGEVILDFIEQREPDLVILGNRGMGTLKRALLGSTSTYVLNNTECPVLIIKEPK